MNVPQAYCHAAVTVGIERIEVDADIAVAAGVDHHRVNHRLDVTINDLRRILAGSVQEEMLLVVLIIRTVDITITQRKFQVRRELATPLAYLAIFLRCFNRLVDRQQSLLIILWDQTGNGIFRLTAIDALRLEDIGKRDTAWDNELRCTDNFLTFLYSDPIYILRCEYRPCCHLLPLSYFYLIISGLSFFPV